MEKKHLYHLVDESPWPLVTAFSVQGMLLGAVMYMQSIYNGFLVLSLGLISTILCAMFWWRDVIREGTYEGEHTKIVQRGLRIGMILFIVSEVMFFVAFFWAYFHSSLSPAIEIGSIWPPAGINTFNPWQVPFLNTLILLLSGATITWAHHAIIIGDLGEARDGLDCTIALALAFTALQVYEYSEASFSIADGIYGSTFFMATGFHGFHVIIGTTFITVCKYRLDNYHFTREHHVGFEAAAWYWHFVDVVWLFLFTTIYWWGSL
jgi:heme/copper-type cytochrome/quinol oxidase subunit 3